MSRPQRNAELLRLTDQGKRAVTTPATTITVPAGAIGALVNFQFPIFPILNSAGGVIGGDGDTSITISGTVFTNEVSNQTADADLANGDFWVDYTTGEARGRKANSGTSLSWTWKYFVPGNSNASGVETFAISPGTAQARGTEDVAGADTYTTILTVGAAATNLAFSLQGSNDAILSIDGGVTEFMTLPAGYGDVLTNLTLAAGAVIQAKNKTPGSNYANLNISVW